DNILFVDNSDNYVYQLFNDPNDAGNLPAADAMGNVVPTFDHDNQDVENMMHFLNGLLEPVRDQYINQAPQFAPPAMPTVDNTVPANNHDDQGVKKMLYFLNSLSEPVHDQYINQAPQFALPVMPVAENAGVGYTAFGDNSGVGALPFDTNGMPVAENNLAGGALGPLFPGAYVPQPLNQIGGDLWQNTPSNDLFAELDRLAALPQSTVVPVVPAIPGQDGVADNVQTTMDDYFDFDGLLRRVDNMSDADLAQINANLATAGVSINGQLQVVPTAPTESTTTNVSRGV
ncbi:hypothetical protein FBU31_007352, partial [Coemansia sp. 'formosensis']